MSHCVPRFVCRFWTDQSAATAIEYALIAGSIAVAIIVSVAIVSDAVEGKFNLVASSWP